MRTLWNVVEGEILRCLYSNRVDDGLSKRTEALALAAHVFMYLTLRQVPSRIPLVCRMCTRLQDAIRVAHTEREVWAGHKTALLWIAFVGLLGTDIENGTGWNWFWHLFQSTLQQISQDFGIALETYDIQRMFRGFLWDEIYCQPLLVRLLIGVS